MPRAQQLLVLALLCPMVTSQAFGATAKSVMIDAINNSDNGTASDVLTGAAAEVWKAQSKSDSPISINAKVVKRFKQPNCARVGVDLKQENVPTKDGKAAPFGFHYELNLCTDGLPPADSVDWSKVNPEAPSASPSQLK
ncbi:MULTISPECIES: hypothetical protein [Herbaspirillum]|uniref:Uncharacterized protein n=2 Tax=Herbaspirillum huttiense TaxID=863372 RepID=A0AAJ2H5A4_9BURK|nr:MULTISPECIES: hypothetical protein [Herbaspirillum]MDR9837037.1 hypothetical protein [Herbaspirillum huttiense]